MLTRLWQIKFQKPRIVLKYINKAKMKVLNVLHAIQNIQYFPNQRTIMLTGEEYKQTWGHTGSHCAKAGDYIFLGACGWSCPLRLIKNGLDIKGPLSFNLFAAMMLRSNGVL